MTRGFEELRVSLKYFVWSVLVRGFIRKWRIGRERSLGSIGGGGMFRGSTWVKLDIMAVKRKATETDKLINSIQAKVDKLKRERKAGKRKEPRSIDIICTSEDIEKTVGKR